VKAIFSIKGAKLAKQIAIMDHMIEISTRIFELGQKFLELKTIEKQKALQKDAVEVARKRLAYAKSRQSRGAATLLEVEESIHNLREAEALREKLAVERASIIESLKHFAGLEPELKLDVNSEEAGRQVLKDFNPKTVGLEQARANSLELKIQKKREKLQDWNVILAYSKYIPTLDIGVKTADLAQPKIEGAQQYVPYIGVQLPIWTVFKRSRNVLRQKRILRQIKAKTRIGEANLNIQLQEAQGKLQIAAIEMEVARSKEKLADLEVRQQEIRYKSITKPLSVLLDARFKYFEAKREMLSKIGEYELTALRICHISGQLFKRYVRVEP
jgi:outer membrane protein TolC